MHYSKIDNKRDRKTTTSFINTTRVVVGNENKEKRYKYDSSPPRSSSLLACIICPKVMDKGKNVQRDQTDRSKIRILLCDINAESCQEILALLSNCSYQVAAVWSARELFDTLSTEGPRANIILAEVGLLMANDARILKHIMREKELREIPVIILTTKDQVSITIKGLKLGAADYLVKPLHVEELLNLWEHSQK
ncbi:hypothetical protein BUALT_Bualt02G0153100 [Buddleja alternifolia]|uniref:Response regulatory domain-containing protein n=1 Tax=Buddleja alternifolia TaxID=168488 RepID=A0AAV6Y1P9_9LAMI|nr:hypothetical protein BUALT_Bualt02G0153100 [Buddleja alternifolia]